MTVDAHPPTEPEIERQQRECDHAPDHATIEADDTDRAAGETVYVAECRYCFAHIKTAYIGGDPEAAAWTAPEHQWVWV